MKRTTIMLPGDLRDQAMSYARRHGISLGELIREALAARLARKDGASSKRDPIFDAAVWKGPVPSDLSLHHDDYLYGEEP